MENTITGSVYGLFCACPDCKLRRPGEIRYVGITVKTLHHRLRAHINEVGKTHKNNWISKHGRDNIRFVLLDTANCIPSLKALELEWIERLETFDSGLNATRGGDGVWGLKMSDTSRSLFRERTARQMSIKHPRARITEGDVRAILDRLWSGDPATLIARDYPVESSTIQKISDGKNWVSVPRPIGPKNKPRDHRYW